MSARTTWRVRELSDLVTKGTTPTTIGRSFTSRGVIFIKVETITPDGGFIWGREAYIDPATHSILRRSQLADGDILLSIAGALGRSTVVEESWLPANTNQAFAIIRPSRRRKDVDPRYLLWQLRSPAISARIAEINVQAAQANLSLEQVRDFEIPLVHIAQQRAISEALDDADRLVATLEALIAKKQAVKQGMMQQLLTGKTRLPGFDGDWLDGTFAQLASPSRERARPRDVPPATPLVDLDQLESGSGRLLSSSRAAEAVSLKAVFEPGDVLFGKLRAYLRKFWYADVAGLCTTEIWVLRARAGVHGRFVRYVVETDQFINVASGAYGTHMPRSDWGTVRELPVVIPAIREQLAIASVLGAVDDEIARLERRAAKARNVRQGMMQELLTGRTRLPVEESAA